ncbi:MAG: DoxX family membrane protein [bacterium]
MKKLSLYAMSMLYIAAGISHFINTAFYLTIIPFYLPFPRELIYLSGVCEIVFGLLLIPKITRRTAAWLIIILLIAIFPANIQMTMDYFNKEDPLLWLTIIRLPVQILLIWWAWTFTKST